MAAAETAGLWSSEEFSFEPQMNPYYLRGDFDGDGRNDVAAWVRRISDGRRGLAIVHATLDAFHLFGAGEPLWPEMSGTAGDPGNAFWVISWRVLPVGYVEQSLYTTNESIGVRAGEPFRFEHEAIEFYYDKSAFVLYWSGGRYHVIVTVD